MNLETSDYTAKALSLGAWDPGRETRNSTLVAVQIGITE